MQKLLTLSLSLILIASATHAAPGETEAAVEARYGKPVKKFQPPKGRIGSTVAVYRTSTLEIGVWFFEGEVTKEEFTKLKDEAFTDTEIQALLKANAPKDVSWINVHSEIGGESWRRSDLKALASTSPGGKTLNFMRVKY